MWYVLFRNQQVIGFKLTKTECSMLARFIGIFKAPLAPLLCVEKKEVATA